MAVSCQTRGNPSESFNARPQQCAEMYRCDMAIVKVNRPFEWDALVQPACLPVEEMRLSAGLKFSVVGNGYTDYDTQALTDTLQVGPPGALRSYLVMHLPPLSGT